jgi:ribosomal-protein-alanine N-acetyltransferase
MGKIKFILKNITQEDIEFFNESELFENTNLKRTPESIIVKDLKYDVVVTDQQAEINRANDRHIAVIGLDREIEKDPQMQGGHSNAASDNTCDENAKSPASQPRISSRFVIGSLWALDQEFIKKVHDLTYRIPHVILETERTIIKQCDPERDILPLIEIYSKPHVKDYVENLYPFAEETVYQRDYFDNIYALYDFGMWNVFLKETGQLIGRCGAEYMQPPEEIEKMDDQWLELGYLIDSDYWHMGLGYETTKAVTEMALARGHRQIFAEINPLNTASIKLAKKLGFVRATSEIWIFDAHNVSSHSDSNACR